MKPGYGRLAGDGVYGRLLGTYAIECREPRLHILVSGIVHVMPAPFAAQKYRLHDHVALERGEGFDLLLYVIGSNGAIKQPDVVRIGGVELKDIVVHEHERVVNPGLMCFCSVGKYRDLCIRGDSFSQLHCRLYSLGKFWRRGRLAVPGKRDDVGECALVPHFHELLFERIGHDRSGVVAV